MHLFLFLLYYLGPFNFVVGISEQLVLLKGSVYLCRIPMAGTYCLKSWF